MEPSLEGHLEQLVRRHAELREVLGGIGLTGADFAKLSKEYSELSPIVGGIDALRRARDELASLTDLAQSSEDAELKSLAQDELQTLRERLPALEQQVKLALLPKDADDERNSILEVRAGTGGAEEVDVRIDDKDLRVDVFRASGPGGQSVNTTDSAVRITHLPTGLVVIQQDEKSQHKNKAKALKVLRSRLYEMERQARDSARAAQRKSQVGSGDRSERIRTYNFPQGRVTDHRINLTLYKIDKVMSGEALDEIVDALHTEDQAARLATVEG